jgi:hypothetical protein
MHQNEVNNAHGAYGIVGITILDAKSKGFWPSIPPRASAPRGGCTWREMPIQA